ncbi:hypothetical protein [Corynebacterium sp.]|uniref:hypothetical protein n=1 Tax=Corynebacterium sp. TaxID=1720 RepID=UPI002A9134E9|nr:hypothetical protein [Corynebacterium sp.]MDY5785061.1 hypothetical protein [Corynebacterium sp.]
MLSSPAANYALGGALVLVTAFSFTFLTDSTAVFVGVAAAVAAAVLIIRGVQMSGSTDEGYDINRGFGTDVAPGPVAGPPAGLGSGLGSGFGSGRDTRMDAGDLPGGEIDWDSQFRREFGGDNPGGSTKR